MWARAGAKGIVITARNLLALNRLAEELKVISPSTNILAIKTDISNEDDVKNLFAQIQKTFGRAANVLLNNAGILEDSHIIDTPVEQWWKTMVRALVAASSFYPSSFLSKLASDNVTRTFTDRSRKSM